MLHAQILPEWSEAIRASDVWQWNDTSAEELGHEIDLKRLGELSVRLTTEQIYTTEIKRNARDVRAIIDLSFGTPAVHSSTGLLVEASLAQLGEIDPLTEQLIARNRASSNHGSDEPWFLPLTGVKIVEVENISA